MSLKTKTANGLLWGGFSSGIQQLLNFVFGIVLARILSQSDYGMVGMLMIFTLIASAIQESGFVSSLINRKNVTDADYNAVFWFSAFMGLALYVLLFFCAPLIAGFYEIPELTSLSRYVFLSFFISSTATAHNAYLFRHLLVKERALTSLLAVVISGSVGVAMALWGYAYWGIATQNLLYVSVTTGGFWYYSKFRPSFTFDFSPVRQMFSFSFKVLVTNIVQHINNNVFSVLLGKLYNEREVGIYTQANKWNTMAQSVITGMGHSIAQPVLASVTDSDDRQARVFRKILNFISFVSFPAMFALAIVAREFITVTITVKWIQSARLLEVLAVAGAVLPVTNLFSNMILSRGKSDIYMWNMICQGLLQLLLLFMLYPFGIMAMIYSYVCLTFLWVFVWIGFVRRETNVAFTSLAGDIFKYAVVAAATAVAAYTCSATISNVYVRLVVKLSIHVALYVVILKVFRSVILQESLYFIRSRIKGK